MALHIALDDKSGVVVGLVNKPQVNHNVALGAAKLLCIAVYLAKPVQYLLDAFVRDKFFRLFKHLFSAEKTGKLLQSCCNRAAAHSVQHIIESREILVFN